LTLNGTLIHDPDLRDDDQGWSSPPATDDQGNSWAFNGSATWQAPTGTDTVSLYATGDQGATDVVNEADASSPLFSSIDDDPATPNDADWINNTDDAGEAWFDVTDLPTDFDTMDSVEIVVRWRGQNFGSGTVELYARLYESDESTPLTDEELVATATSNTSFANTSPVVFSTVEPGDQTTWDGARLRLRWAGS
jgi:hypothetical protein